MNNMIKFSFVLCLSHSLLYLFKCMPNDNLASIESSWKTPRPGEEYYQASYQDYHSLVGYADIKYTDPSRKEADICLIVKHRDPSKVVFKYFFDNVEQSNNCKRFKANEQKNSVKLRVEASDNTKLTIDSINLIWNVVELMNRPGDYRNGQKGGIVELFGWRLKDIENECEIIGKAGYLGIKLCPVNEHIMSDEPEQGAMNPWYYMYQPISYRFNSRAGTSEELMSLIKTCRSKGVRIYVDIVLNHFTGLIGGCKTKFCGRSSAPFERQSPFYAENTNDGKTINEYPGATFGPEDIHVGRSIEKWNDLTELNQGWLSGLADVNTTRENVRERQASFVVELLSAGVSGFRLDAAKHMSPEDLAAIFQLIQLKMGGQLPHDLFFWLEILSGGEKNVLWEGPSWYGKHFNDLLMNVLNSADDLDKIKIFDGGYPSKPWDNAAIPSRRIVIENDDHDSQSPMFFRDFGNLGCVLVKGCAIEEHRGFEMRMFENPYEVRDSEQDWPVRILLSSFYHTYGKLGIPDGFSDCSLAKTNADQCKESVPYLNSFESGKCGYEGNGYTRVHRDVKIINSMRKWMKLTPITGADIGLPNCN